MRSFLVIPAIDKYLYKTLSDKKIKNADTIMFDLEDGITDKESGIDILKSFFTKQKTNINNRIAIRIDRANYLEQQIDLIKEHSINLVAIPKVNRVSDVKNFLNTFKKETLMWAIEDFATLKNTDPIFELLPSNSLVVLGIRDLSSQISVNIEKSEYLSAYIHSEFLIACSKYDLLPVDTVSHKYKFSSLYSFYKDCKINRELGYLGKIAIHPNQTNIINKVFNNKKLLETYSQIIKEFEKKQSFGKFLGENILGVADKLRLENQINRIKRYNQIFHPTEFL